MHNIMSFINNPSVLYAIGLTAVCILVALLALSVWYYHRAKNLVPYLYEIKILNEQKGILKNRIGEAQKTIQQLNEEYDSRLVDIAQAKQVIAEKENAESWLADNAPKVEGLKSELASLEQTCSDIKDKVDERKKELSDLTQELANKTLERDSIAREKEALSNEKSRLEVEKTSLEATRKEYDAKIVELSQKIDTLIRQKTDLESEMEKLEKKYQEQNDKIIANKDKLLALENIDEKLEAKANLIKEKEQQLANLTGAVADVMDQIKAGLDRLERMNLTGVQTLRLASFKELKEPVFSIKTKGEKYLPAHTDEAIALREVQNHLREAGFNVPNRLLFAFHTSLKASEMSSLTVMAGVSGTGKSALPKLYSEAMGICFQPLAVEPRWDSPKDLLGFFNYVTNHYEPTMLARAFLQFQGVHPVKEDGYTECFIPKEDLSDYMLMPLLDEMNLARIEYYFSEFLSKLELRRLQGQLTFKNTRSVSLELFQGFSGIDANGKKVKESPIRLFANTNTLFVGTMNEDETTQSLSDKVIDRANVLYFGRPAKLESSFAGSRSQLKPRNFLLKTTWEGWLKKMEQVPDAVQDKLTRLNMLLAELNRPFAHRTYQAILSYVANYPELGQSYDRINRALADQIGMRVMPKLRGLDLRQNQEVFSKVEEIVKELGDNQLCQAFDAAYNLETNHSGFFQWSGFDWNQDENV